MLLLSSPDLHVETAEVRVRPLEQGVCPGLERGTPRYAAGMLLTRAGISVSFY
jgi:hypothetical protein